VAIRITDLDTNPDPDRDIGKTAWRRYALSQCF